MAFCADAGGREELLRRFDALCTGDAASSTALSFPVELAWGASGRGGGASSSAQAKAQTQAGLQGPQPKGPSAWDSTPWDMVQQPTGSSSTPKATSALPNSPSSSTLSSSQASNRANTASQTATLDAAARTLTTILLALRKLREALTATSRADDFAVQALLFSVRLGILVRQPEAYHAPLLRLLRLDGNASNGGRGSGGGGVLTSVERTEVVGYLVLDTACRRGLVREARELMWRWGRLSSPCSCGGDLHQADHVDEDVNEGDDDVLARAAERMSLGTTVDEADPRQKVTTATTPTNDVTVVAATISPAATVRESRPRCRRHAFGDGKIDMCLHALARDDWVAFARLLPAVDTHRRRLMETALPDLRRHVLKAFGRAYMSVDRTWIERCTGMAWEDLRRVESVGWELADGDKVIIRRPKAKGTA